jgi:Mg-chelatase subunit ChlD
MEFCSRYGYDYGQSGSDEEEMDDFDSLTNDLIKKKVRKADSNIISFKFDDLVNKTPSDSSAIIKCSKCNAIFSRFSGFKSKSQVSAKIDDYFWPCEYCSTVNNFSIEFKNLNNLILKDDVTYLIEGEKKQKNDLNPSNDTYLTYCIDTSGSMKTRVTCNDSRLQCVKTACIQNLLKLKETEPNKKVSLLSFNTILNYYGDGLHCEFNEPLINESYKRFSIDKKKMLSYAQAVSESEKLCGVFESCDKLKEIILRMNSDGATALGPALTFCIGYLSGVKAKSSQIILCTDGLANAGMGDLGIIDLSESEIFYNELADFAKENSISINIITIEGTNCHLNILGKLCDKTNGYMSIVDATKVSDEFKTILENKTVATNVKVSLIVNEKYLYIRDTELEFAEGKAIDEFGSKKECIDAIDKLKKSQYTCEVGIANEDSEVSFEYGMRRLQTKSSSEGLCDYVFQLQIEYSVGSSKFLRVITKSQEFTGNVKRTVDHILSRKTLYSNAMQRMSEAMDKNPSYAKYRSHALSSFSSLNGFERPKELKRTQEMCNTFDSVDSMNDTQSVSFYNDRKRSQKNFSV